MKESKSYNISVEGECEKYYFDHLAELINNYEKATYKVKFSIKKKNPLSFAKTRNNIYAQKGKKSEGYIKYFHIQDIEDYYSDEHREKFYSVIDEINEAKRICNISVYELGYSNFSFDLWMVLHKHNLNKPVNDRHQYYKYINIGYGKSYTYMDEYKAEDEFKSCLLQIKLDDVIVAIERSKKIRQMHKDNKEHLETYNKFSFYRANPDLTINDVIEEILKDCEII